MKHAPHAPRALRPAALLIAAGISACVAGLPGSGSELTGNGGGRSGTGGGAGAAGMAGTAAPPPPPPPDGGFGGASAAGTDGVGPGAGGMATGTGGVGPGTGGMGPGAGGAPNACNPKPCSANPQPGSICMGAPAPGGGSLVSSFENACPRIDMVDGRDGQWFEYVNGVATASPNPAQPFVVSCVGAQGSCFSACVSGSLTFDAEVGLGFYARANTAAYDVSAYRGIGFFYQASFGPSSTGRLQARMASDPKNGNTVLGAHGVPLYPVGTWQYQEVAFTDLQWLGQGTPLAWDPTAVVSFVWNVSGPGPAGSGPEPFTICVDQVSLLPTP